MKEENITNEQTRDHDTTTMQISSVTPKSIETPSNTAEGKQQLTNEQPIINTIVPTVAKGLQPQQQASQPSQAPKSSNTIFIHKLYNILEDKDLEDLIWWSNDGKSFLIRPTERFSKALATYFKHTNITSFVRQLNIYGFHKVSNDHQYINNKTEDDTTTNVTNHANTDVNNNITDNEQVKIWEFKHSAGIFRKGDVESLKLIKRRSSSRNISSMNSRKASNATPSRGSSSNYNYNNNTNMNILNMPSNLNTNASSYGQVLQPGNIESTVTDQNAKFVPSQLSQYPNIVEGNINVKSNPSFYKLGINQQKQHQLMQAQDVPFTPYPSTESIPMIQQYRQVQPQQYTNTDQGYEQPDPQYTHESVEQTMKAANMDMIKLIDYMQKFVSLLNKNTNGIISEPSIGTSLKDNEMKQQWDEFQSEITNFKRSILSRLQINAMYEQSSQNKTQQLQQQTHQGQQHLTPNDTNSMNRHSYPIIMKPQSIYSQQTATEHVNTSNNNQTPGNINMIQQAIPLRPHTAPLSVIQSVPQSSDSNGNNQIPIDTYNSAISSNGSTGKYQMMQNPFNSNASSRYSSKRHRSVLLDPLTPVSSLNSSSRPSLSGQNNRKPSSTAIPIHSVLDQNSSTIFSPRASISTRQSLTDDQTIVKRNSQSSLPTSIMAPPRPTSRSPINKDALRFSRSANSLPNIIAPTILNKTVSTTNSSPVYSLLNNANVNANSTKDIHNISKEVPMGSDTTNMNINGNRESISSNNEMDIIEEEEHSCKKVKYT
ncbi:Sfl1p NDAI_0C01380 [Naumovozyma dairenensis CBS 421]|uniref:HSF-type DNA-binding domain-containing protein n=1 Tax=Naumovozyma dairenensis (strain ATCC 10597 / BCRC 20456 / CBS 421 / NBRC 0211 / NRRL Y-12639) TaxID=1071378 RepID=G0W7N8_NAUDC|nr:hypothetical protein NDAI_0C01380 [Naumovozyma dairenensis CBS 421]CCD23799.1 hypothetical protein NDAI_0C01380 [Naumovozyma dairenensis CBS 421]